MTSGLGLKLITLTVGWGCFNSAAFRPILSFWTLLGYFWESGSGSKTFLGPTHLDYQLWFWNLAISFKSGSSSKTFLRPTYIDCQLCFWKHIPNLLLQFRPILGIKPFLGSAGLFLGLGLSSKTFWEPTYIV